MDSNYEYEVQRKIDDKPRLTAVFSSTLNIPNRLHEYNERLFICYNNVSERFEVHSLDQEFSFCAELPYKKLDARTLRWIWKNDVRVHGKALMDELEQNLQNSEKAKDREYRNWIEAVGKETKSMFAKDAWQYGT